MIKEMTGDILLSKAGALAQVWLPTLISDRDWRWSSRTVAGDVQGWIGLGRRETAAGIFNVIERAWRRRTNRHPAHETAHGVRGAGRSTVDRSESE